MVILFEMLEAEDKHWSAVGCYLLSSETQGDPEASDGRHGGSPHNLHISLIVGNLNSELDFP